MKQIIRFKRLLVILGIALLISIPSYYYFFMRTYSLSEINADNYYNLLKESSEIINEGEIFYSVEMHFLFNAFALDEQENESYKITRSKSEKYLIVQNLDKSKNLLYSTTWKGANYDKLTRFLIMNVQHGGKYELRRIVDELLIKEGFTLKQSRLKDGNDILIKETKKAFIIVRLGGSYNDNSNGLYIEKYTNRK